MPINTPNNGKYWNALSSDGSDPVAYILELVDNSIDAGAKNIEIEYSSGESGRLVIRDDGSGMSSDAVVGLTSLGYSDKDSGSGRYGTGFKSAFSSIGRRVEVITSDGTECTKLVWDIDVDIETGIWGEGGDVHRGSTPLGPDTGTRVIVDKIRSRKAFSKNVTKEIRKHLTPALKNGVNVSYNGEVLSPFVLYWDEDSSPAEGEFESPKGYRFRYKIGKADTNSLTKADCGWYVYKNSRAVAEYTGTGKGLNDSERTLVWIELLQEDHSANEWPLDAYSKSRLSDSEDWNWLVRFVKDKSERFVSDEKTEKINMMISGMATSLCSSFAESFKKSSNGDHGVTEVDGGKDMVDVPRGSHGGGGKSSGGADAKDGYVAGNGNTHKFSKTVRRGGLSIIPTSEEALEERDWNYTYNQEEGTLVIRILSDMVVHAKGSGVHAMRALVANAMLEWEDHEETKICPRSEELNSCRAARHLRLVNILGRK